MTLPIKPEHRYGGTITINDIDYEYVTLHSEGPGPTTASINLEDKPVDGQIVGRLMMEMSRLGFEPVIDTSAKAWVTYDPNLDFVLRIQA